MRFPAPTTRSLRGVLAASLATAALAAVGGCTAATLPVPAYGKDLPRLYISAVRYRVRGEIHGPNGGPQGLNLLTTTLATWKDLGTYLTPDYIVTIDPEFIVQTTTNRDIPATEFFDATVFNPTGNTSTQRMLRNPLFFLDYVKIKYNVPGYSLPERTYNLNMAMKQTFVVIDHLPVSNADDVVKALWDKPDTTPPAVGTADIEVWGRDADPLLLDNKEPKALVSRSFPVRYTYGSALLGEAVQNETPLQAPQPAVFGTPTPAPSPSASASASPAP